jgi:cytoskeletal protein RodZ
MAEMTMQEAGGTADWVTAGIICGIVILVALISILYIRWHDNRKYGSPCAEIKAQEVPITTGASEKRKRRAAAVAEVRKSKAQLKEEKEEHLSQPHVVSPVLETSPAKPIEPPKKMEPAPTQEPVAPDKSQIQTQQGVNMEKPMEHKNPVSTTPAQKPDPAPKTADAKPPGEKAGSAFDIFTSSNVEDSAIGKMAAKLDDVNLDVLSSEAQDLMRKIKGLK